MGNGLIVRGVRGCPTILGALGAENPKFSSERVKIVGECSNRVKIVGSAPNYGVRLITGMHALYYIVAIPVDSN